jgi:hypothetical protein
MRAHIQALHPFNLSSALDDATLKEMRQMELSSGASFISFQVRKCIQRPGCPPPKSTPNAITSRRRVRGPKFPNRDLRSASAIAAPRALRNAAILTALRSCEPLCCAPF